MAYHTVTNLSAIAAQDVIAYNCDFVSASSLDNGNICQLLTSASSTAGLVEVFTATAPSSASPTGIYIIDTPVLPFVVTGGGDKINGIGTARDFYTIAGEVGAARRLQLGDIVVFSAENLDSSTVAAYAIADDSGNFKLKWSAVTVSGFYLQYIATTYISVPDGTIGTGRVTAYKFKVAHI
jgi:hypothetical protein